MMMSFMIGVSMLFESCSKNCSRSMKIQWLFLKEHYEDQGGYGYGVRNKKGKKIIEFSAAINIAVGRYTLQEAGKSYSQL